MRLWDDVQQNTNETNLKLKDQIETWEGALECKAG